MSIAGIVITILLCTCVFLGLFICGMFYHWSKDLGEIRKHYALTYREVIRLNASTTQHSIAVAMRAHGDYLDRKLTGRIK